MKTKDNKMRVEQMVLGVVLCVFILFFLYGFFRYYQALEQSLREERALYVDEISEQLTGAITAKREWLISRIGASAAAFEQSDADTFEKVHDLYAYKEKENYTVLLVADTGATYFLNGKTAQIRNFDILNATLEKNGPAYHFDKSSDGIDYWVFSAAVKPRIVDGVTIVAVYEIYDVAQFHDDLYLGLFGDDGYAYIVDLSGGIQLGPKREVDFIGYNLISSLIKAEIAEDDAEKIRTDISEKFAGSMFTNFHGTDWAVHYMPLTDSDEMVVVIAPIAETSRETTNALQYTLMSVCGVILGLFILVLSIIVVNVRDSKERDRQVYELELKSRVASTKNDFLAKMSHDIRTPLNAIIGMNYIATTQISDTEPVMDCLKQIDISAKYLLGILNDILDMSKIESGKMELRYDVFNSSEILDAVAAISNKQAAEKDIDFCISVDEKLSEAYIGDKQRIAQILMNLTNNAIKYTECGGRIDVGFSMEKREEHADVVRFTVEDTGIGMTDEYMKNLFLPFTQDRSNNGVNYTSGSGLGLSIVKSFVDMMNGTITVNSERGKGTKFDVVISLERAMPEEHLQEVPEVLADESILVGKHVLLAEDNEINLLIAQIILTKFGMLVETAADGKEALEKYLQADTGCFDIIITDIKMPQMNGYELTEAVRNAERDDAKSIPIFAMSANAFDDDILESLSYGMNVHLKKPVEVEELKNALLRFLGGGG